MATMSERLMLAWNSLDARRVAALFDEDYLSEQPVHPGRSFTGRSQVLANWSSVFEGVPDFTARLVGFAMAGETEWSEWDWSGRHPDNSAFAMRGVTILLIREDLIARGRLYMEPVDPADSGIDAAVRELYQPPATS